ncbi:MAG: hypothetical protein HIU90_01445 [Proteobacteria bacterium]|nr:hypothetical protein [Pseudomonadota bacterium]
MNHLRPTAPLDAPPDWPEPPIELYATEAIEPEPSKPNSIDQVQSLRARLFDAGYRPVPIYNHDHPVKPPVKSPGKQPMGKAWQIEARTETPSCTVMPSAREARNTGVLCDGLRAVDIDIDDPDRAGTVKSLAIEMLGDAPLRWRGNSPKVLLVYRAATGEPVKQSIVGAGHSKEPGKSNLIEVLGLGQQFVGYGTHPSGAEIQWQANLLENPRDTLPAVTEDAIRAFLAAAAGIIGAPTPKAETDHQPDHQPSQFGPGADGLDVAGALACIPNLTRDWDHWCRIGMATFAASRGSPEGYAAWCAWSARCTEAHDLAACRDAWRGYKTNHRQEIGAGTLFHLAQEARQGWTKPTDTVRGDPDRPDLVEHTGDLPATQRAAMRLIEARAIPLRVFARDGTPTRLIAPPDEPARFHRLTHHGITDLTHTVARPIRVKVNGKTGETETVPVTFPERAAKAMMDSADWRLPAIDGVAVTPLLSDDGTIRAVEGYDPQTRLWCHAVPHIQVPPRPSRADAAQALRTIRELFSTFPFADATRTTAFDLDVVDPDQPPKDAETALLNGLLTAIAKPSLDLTPGLLIAAPDISGSGSGKGLLVKAICAIAYGAPPAAFTAGSAPGELDKRITSALIEAGNAVFLDNVNATALRSDTLASVITERPAWGRVFGETRMALLNSTAFVAVTGNGLSVSEDLARRFLACELDPKCDDPEAREFPDGHDGFLTNIKARRGELLTAALTIWRWGRQAEGKLTKGKPFGSFETWARWIRDPLLTLGCADPVEAIARAKARDPRRIKLAELFDQWWADHHNYAVPAARLSEAVKGILDPQNRGRNYIVSTVNAYVGTRAAGFVLTRQDAEGRWGHATYALKQVES